MKCSLGISNFLEEISSLSPSIVFLYFFALITEEGFLVSHCSFLELWIQMGISFLFSFAFHFPSFHAICKASSDSHVAFLHFFSWAWSWFLSPVQCHEPPSIVHQSTLGLNKSSWPSKHLFTKHLLFHLHANCFSPLQIPKSLPPISLFLCYWR